MPLGGKKRRAMRQIIKYICCGVCILQIFTGIVVAKQNKTSKNIFVQRPLFQYTFITTPQIYSQKCISSGLTAIGMYEKSIPDCRQSRYFLFDCKDALSIVGTSDQISQTVQENRDISLTWLDYAHDIAPDTTNNFFSLSPHTKTYGALLSYFKTFDLPIDLFKDSWIGVSAYVQSITNHLELSTNGNAEQTNVISELFNQSDWQYAKVAPCACRKTAIPEIKATFGSTIFDCDNLLVQYVSSLYIPTSDKQNPEYMFSPSVGKNKHWGIEVQLLSTIPLIDGDFCPLNFFSYLSNVFYIRRTHHRTFDLLKKPYSRYMLLRKEGHQETVPAMNLLTLPCKVKTSNCADISFGLNYQAPCFGCSFGYNLWVHPTEKIFIHAPYCSEYREKYRNIYPFEEYGIAGSDKDHSASHATIRDIAFDDHNDDETFTTIKQSDLDLHSPAGQGGSTNTVFGFITLNTPSKHCNFHLGGYYSAAYINTSMSAWGGFFTLQADF